MKDIKQILEEINLQMLQGGNGKEENTYSVDLNYDLTLFVYLDENDGYLVEVVLDDTTEVLADSTCNREQLKGTIELTINNYLFNNYDDEYIIRTKTIETVGDLRRLLDKFSDDLLINFGTSQKAFNISAYSSSDVSLALISKELHDYLAENDWS